MDIYIDHIKLDFELEKTDTLDSVIESVDTFVKSGGKVVGEIVVDGKELEDLLNVSIESITIVEFTTKSARVILMESFKEMEIYIERLKEGIENILAYLEDGNSGEAMGILYDAVNGLEWIYDILSYGETISTALKEKEDYMSLYSNFSDALEAIVSSIESSDYIMLSDILEFELQEILEELFKGIEEYYTLLMQEEEKNQKIS